LLTKKSRRKTVSKHKRKIPACLKKRYNEKGSVITEILAKTNTNSSSDAAITEFIGFGFPKKRDIIKLLLSLLGKYRIILAKSLAAL